MLQPDELNTKFFAFVCPIPVHQENRLELRIMKLSEQLPVRPGWVTLFEICDLTIEPREI